MKRPPLKSTISFICLMLFTIAFWATTPAQAQTVSVTGFSLINADADVPIAEHNPLLPGAVIDRTWTPGSEQFTLSIEAHTTGPVSKVVFGFQGNGEFSTEHFAPYTLFGDARRNDGTFNYAPAPYGTFKTGTYTVTATPYDQNGVPGEKTSVTFTSQWIDFALIDASTNEEVPGYEALTGEVKIPEDVLPEKWSIRANDASPTTRIMGFAFEDNPAFQIEYVRPYAMFGDLNEDYFAAPEGFLEKNRRYKITATPFQNRPFIRENSGKPVTMNLTVVDPEEIKIMLAGDSNTEGNVSLIFNDKRLDATFQNFAGYRLPLWKLLNDAGYKIKFVSDDLDLKGVENENNPSKNYVCPVNTDSRWIKGIKLLEGGCPYDDELMITDEDKKGKKLSPSSGHNMDFVLTPIKDNAGETVECVSSSIVNVANWDKS